LSLNLYSWVDGIIQKNLIPFGPKIFSDFPWGRYLAFSISFTRTEIIPSAGRGGGIALACCHPQVGLLSPYISSIPLIVTPPLSPFPLVKNTRLKNLSLCTIINHKRESRSLVVANELVEWLVTK
jgi:hypothetical protein